MQFECGNWKTLLSMKDEMVEFKENSFTMNKAFFGIGIMVLIFPANNINQVSDKAWNFAFKQNIISLYNIFIFSLSLISLVDSWHKRHQNYLKEW